MSPLRALGLVACAILALWCRLPALGDDISGAINGRVYGGDPDEGDFKPLKAASVYVYLPDNIEGRFVFPPIASRLTNQNGFYSFSGTAARALRDRRASQRLVRRVLAAYVPRDGRAAANRRLLMG